MFLQDDDDYLPPNKRPKNTESANEAANTGRRKVREFNFGKIKMKDFFCLSALFYKKVLVTISHCRSETRQC